MKNITYNVWGWNAAHKDYNKDFGQYTSEMDAIAHADIVDDGRKETVVDMVWKDENGELQSKTIYKA